MTLNQVYAAGWLNETALNRGYSGSGEKMSAIALDNQLDGSVDTGAINHRLLVGIDYQDRSNHTTGYYGAFPPIDAFNPVYGAQPDYITLYSRENISCGRPDTIYRIRCHGIAGVLRWVVVTIGSACLTSTNFMIHAAISIKQRQYPCRVALSVRQWRRPYLSYSTAFTPTSFADENGNVLEPMKGKQWEAG